MHVASQGKKHRQERKNKQRPFHGAFYDEASEKEQREDYHPYIHRPVCSFRLAEIAAYVIGNVLVFTFVKPG